MWNDSGNDSGNDSPFGTSGPFGSSGPFTDPAPTPQPLPRQAVESQPPASGSQAPGSTAPGDKYLEVTGPDGRVREIHYQGAPPSDDVVRNLMAQFAAEDGQAVHHSATQPRTAGRFSGPPARQAVGVPSPITVAKPGPVPSIDPASVPSQVAVPGMGNFKVSSSYGPFTATDSPSDPAGAALGLNADLQNGADVTRIPGMSDFVPLSRFVDPLGNSQAPLAGTDYTLPNGLTIRADGSMQYPDPASLVDGVAPEQASPLQPGDQLQPATTPPDRGFVPIARPVGMSPEEALKVYNLSLHPEMNGDNFSADNPAKPVVAVGRGVANSVRNAAQGYIAPALADTNANFGDYANPVTSTLGTFGSMVNPLNLPRNLSSALGAVFHDDGDVRIGDQVSSLAPNTTAGAIYNIGTGIASDPMNLLPETALGQVFQGIASARMSRFAPFAAAGDAAGSAGSAAFQANPADPVAQIAAEAQGAPVSLPGVPAGPPARQAVGVPSPLTGDPTFGRVATYTRRNGAVVDSRPGAVGGYGQVPDSGPIAGNASPFVAAMRAKQTAVPPRLAVGVEAAAAPGVSPNAPTFANAASEPFPAYGNTPASVSGPFTRGIVDRVASNVQGAVSNVAQRAPGLVKASKIASDVWNLPRSLKLIGDFSAPGRQAALLTAGRPIQAAKAAAAALRSMGSKEAYSNFVERLAGSPLAPERESAGLYLSTRYDSATAPLGAREEAFVSRFTGKIPGVAMTERGYKTYLDALRASSFDQGVVAMRRSVELGAMSPSEYSAGTRAYAKYVNAASGRGSLGALEPAANALATTMFSPRAFVARLQVLNPATYAALPPVARMQAARDLLSYVGATTGALALAKASGQAEVDLDPHSPTFGAVQFHGSNVHIDPWGGYGSMARFVIQEATGQRETSTGYLKPLDGAGTRPETRLSNAGRFAEEQLHPSARLGLTAARGGRNEWGQSVSAGRAVMDAVSPIAYQSIAQAVAADKAKGIVYAPLALLGMGLKPGNKPAWTPPNASGQSPTPSAGK